MSTFNNYSAAFTAANAKAYGKASTVFKRIEANDWTEELAAAGVLPSDIPEFAVVYVAETAGVSPKLGQRGWTFNGIDSVAAARVKYLVSVATGARQVTLAKAKVSNAIDPAAKLAKAYAALSAAEKRAFLRAIGK